MKAKLMAEGETFGLTRPGGRATTETVRPACEVKDQGHWYCETHSEHIPNNFELHGNHDRPRCRLVWICNLHGPEQP